MELRVFETAFSFEWDKGNSNKNLIKHKVNNEECEEVFFDRKRRVLKDILHSGKEGRYIILGATKGQRVLFVVFTIRRKSVRVISARDLSKKERKLYEAKN